jgi:hypothetical protein
MKHLHIYRNEALTVSAILIAFLAYHLDVFRDGMMASGLIVTALVIYIALIWSEKINDERDEYLVSRVDRYLYVVTLSYLLLTIIYKTFIHADYFFEVLLVTILAIAKVIMVNYVKRNH